MLFLSLFCFLSGAIAGNRKSRITSVPFEVTGSYVVVKAKVNNSSPLNFILDSGLSTTLITHLSKEDSLWLNNSERTVLKGLGVGNEISALTSNNNILQTGRMKFVHQTAYFLEEDVFNLSEYTGMKINGLLGSDFFQDLVVKIDYNSKRITFYESSSYEVPKGYIPIPLTFNEDKMYAMVKVTDASGKLYDVRMLIDTGAELGAWFKTFGEKKVAIPEKKIRGYIGQGLNGEINGYIARIPKIQIGNYAVHNVIVSFPDSACISDAIPGGKRDGTLGSQLLNHFNLILDEPNEVLYIKPNANYKKKFYYNIAGIEVIQQYSSLNLPEVFHVWEESPAEIAGILAGDLIISINGNSSFGVNIGTIRHELETRSRRPLKLQVLRGKKTLSFTLEMIDTL